MSFPLGPPLEPSGLNDPRVHYRHPPGGVVCGLRAEPLSALEGGSTLCGRLATELVLKTYSPIQFVRSDEQCADCSVLFDQLVELGAITP